MTSGPKHHREPPAASAEPPRPWGVHGVRDRNSRATSALRVPALRGSARLADCGSPRCTVGRPWGADGRTGRCRDGVARAGGGTAARQRVGGPQPRHAPSPAGLTRGARHLPGGAGGHSPAPGRDRRADRNHRRRQEAPPQSRGGGHAGRLHARPQPHRVPGDAGPCLCGQRHRGGQDPCQPALCRVSVHGARAGLASVLPGGGPCAAPDPLAEPFLARTRVQ